MFGVPSNNPQLIKYLAEQGLEEEEQSNQINELTGGNFLSGLILKKFLQTIGSLKNQTAVVYLVIITFLKRFQTKLILFRGSLILFFLCCFLFGNDQLLLLVPMIINLLINKKLLPLFNVRYQMDDIEKQYVLLFQTVQDGIQLCNTMQKALQEINLCQDPMFIIQQKIKDNLTTTMETHLASIFTLYKSYFNNIQLFDPNLIYQGILTQDILYDLNNIHNTNDFLKTIKQQVQLTSYYCRKEVQGTFFDQLRLINVQQSFFLRLSGLMECSIQTIRNEIMIIQISQLDEGQRQTTNLKEQLISKIKSHLYKQQIYLTILNTSEEFNCKLLQVNGNLIYALTENIIDLLDKSQPQDVKIISEELQVIPSNEIEINIGEDEQQTAQVCIVYGESTSESEEDDPQRQTRNKKPKLNGMILEELQEYMKKRPQYPPKKKKKKKSQPSVHNIEKINTTSLFSEMIQKNLFKQNLQLQE